MTVNENLTNAKILQIELKIDIKTLSGEPGKKVHGTVAGAEICLYLITVPWKKMPIKKVFFGGRVGRYTFKALFNQLPGKLL